MQRQGRRDTAPEMLIRRLLHASGHRFRVDAKLESDLRVRGDIVWRSQRIAVFIDGCFWHGCPIHATSPKANAQWWQDKIAANVARDRRTNEALGDRGWSVLRFWEHEQPAEVVESIVRARAAVGRRRIGLGR